MFSSVRSSLKVIATQQTSFVRYVSLLSSLKPSHNSTKAVKRLGRGPSSGHGKTSGRGQKGQKARSSVKSWFEGGQTPIFKLFPKIGFTPVTSLSLAELNLNRIQQFYESGRLNADEVLTMKKMKDIGLVTGNMKDGVKILGQGKEDFTVPNLKVQVTRASADSIQAIENIGGEVTLKYFNKLNLRSHLHPNWFLRKYNRIPLESRPTKKKVIGYYSKTNNGYLVKEDHALLKIRKSGSVQQSSKKTVSNLDQELEAINKDVTNTVAQNKSGVISVHDL